MVFAITALLVVSSVSASHAHLNRADDACAVCSTAHMAARDVATIQLVHAPQVQSILPLPVVIQAEESAALLSVLTRGPPTSL